MPSLRLPPPGDLIVYLLGCLFFSIGAKFFIDAGLGVDPLDVMVLGIVRHTGLTIGIVAGAVAIVFLAIWAVWNRRVPPISPFVTNFLIGSLIDVWNWVGLEAWTTPVLAPWPMLMSGLVVASYGSALIIMSGIGIRVMDLVAITMVREWRMPFWVAKSIIEVFFCVTGWALGGPIGIGTLMFLLIVAPLIQPFVALNVRWLGLPNHGLPAPGQDASGTAPEPSVRRSETGRRLRDRALEGTFWASADAWGRQLVSLLVFVLLARLLTPVEIGLFAMVAIVLAAAQTLLDEGLTEVVVQRDRLEPGHLDAAFWIVAAASLALGVLIVLLAGPIATLFDEAAIAPLVAVASVVPVLAGLSCVHQGILRRRMEYRLLMIRSMAGVVAGGAVGLWMAWNGHGAWALVGQQIADRLVGGLVLWVSAGWRPRLRFSASHARDLLPYSTWLAGTRVVNFTSKQVDRYLIGLMMGPAVLGIYNVATRVSDTAYGLLAQGLSNIGMNVFARLQNEREALRKALVSASEMANVVAFPIFLGLSAVAPTLVTVIFGPQWSEAGPILSVLALLGIPAMFSTFTGALMRALGTTRLLMGVLVLSAVANIAAVAATVSHGLLVVAIAILVRNLCFVPLFLLIQQRLAGVPPMETVRRNLPALAAAVAMALVVAWTGDTLAARGWPSTASLAVQVAAGGIAYLLLLGLLGRGSLLRFVEVFRAYRRRSVQPAT